MRTDWQLVMEDLVETMEETVLSDVEPGHEINVSKRKEPPAHYVLKIESFTTLLRALGTSKVDMYESRDFESSGYKWKLLLYPDGEGKNGGESHISLYLATADKTPAFEAHVVFKLFIFDQLRDQYLTVGDGRIRRFYALKARHGFAKLISHTAFKDPSNGYLVDDCCAFGAEVHIVNFRGEGEKFLAPKQPQKLTWTWKLDMFSELEPQQDLFSPVFRASGHDWVLRLCPRGDYSRQNNTDMALYLYMDDCDLHPRKKVLANFTLFLIDQLKRKHIERSGIHWFCHSSEGSGYFNFVSLRDLHDTSRGFMVKDTLIVVIELLVVSVVEGLI